MVLYNSALLRGAVNLSFTDMFFNPSCFSGVDVCSSKGLCGIYNCWLTLRSCLKLKKEREVSLPVLGRTGQNNLFRKSSEPAWFEKSSSVFIFNCYMKPC